MKKFYLLLCLAIILFYLLAIEHNSIAQKRTNLKLLGIIEQGGFLPKLIPPEDMTEIEKAVAKTFVKTYPGGNKREAYSKNGEYKILKSPHPKYVGDEKAEMAPIISTLVDKNGNILWRGETDEDVFISNNGRNFVSGNLTYGVGIKFYDISFPKPIKSYDIGFDGGAFSDDGRYFIAWAKDLYLFEADGDLLWKKEFTFHGTKKAIISSQGSFIMINDKPAEQPEQVKQSKRPFEDEKPSFPIPIERINKIMRVKILREQGRFVEADSLEKELSKLPPTEKIEPKNIKRRTPIKLPRNEQCTLTILRNNGTLQVISLKEPRIQEMAFSPDEKYAVVGCNNRALLFETATGNLLWEYECERTNVVPYIYFIDISDKYIALSGKYFPILGKTYDAKNPQFLYLINYSGEKIAQLGINDTGIPPLVISKGGKYIVVRSSKSGKIHILEKK